MLTDPTITGPTITGLTITRPTIMGLKIMGPTITDPMITGTDPMITGRALRRARVRPHVDRGSARGPSVHWGVLPIPGIAAGPVSC